MEQRLIRTSQPPKSLPSEILFEDVEDDLNGDAAKFDEIINELVELGFLEMLRCLDDQFIYKARTGLKWDEIVKLADPIKKNILLQLIQNPKNFFVLFNTQRGKLRIIGVEIAQWLTQYPTDRVVSYLVVSNDRTLAEQSTNGLYSCFPQEYNVRIFELSSNNKMLFDSIITYIDAYAYNPSYPMPLIVLLDNNTQIEKLIKILVHIKNHACRSLKAGGGWDEADITYPKNREKNFTVKGETTNFVKLLNDPSEFIIRNGFVTATEGGLMDEEYEECYNAHCYEVEIDPAEQVNYMSFHHPECKKNFITASPKETNNSIATKILETNWHQHFNLPLKLRDGTTPYHHKIIINSDSTRAEMRKFAKKFADRAHVLTFNMRGVMLYNTTHPEGKRYPTHKQNLNKLLFYIYKMNNLDDKPLIILGRRKVDRGLGFHYAPRTSSGSRAPVLTIPGPDGDLTTDGTEGLIWTDMIMGNKIVHIPTAVQKAGRGAGIIRQCPQYPGEFHYWIDETTSEHIMHHYQKVDAVHILPGSNSMIQAITHASAIIPAIQQQNHNVDENTFRVVCGATESETMETVKKIITEVFKETFRRPRRDDVSRKYKTAMNDISAVTGLLDAVKSVPTRHGGSVDARTYRRFIPCYKDLDDPNAPLYCVIPLIDPKYKLVNAVENKTTIQIMDEKFEEKFIQVPRRGPIP
jgi:hypothetical protein